MCLFRLRSWFSYATYWLCQYFGLDLLNFAKHRNKFFRERVRQVHNLNIRTLRSKCDESTHISSECLGWSGRPR